MHMPIFVPLVALLVSLSTRGVAGPAPASFGGYWYRWDITYGNLYDPHRILMHKLENPATSPFRDAANDANLRAIERVARNDPMLQKKNLFGQKRYWMFLNEPDLAEWSGGWGSDWRGAAKWYAAAYKAVKQNDPYNQSVIIGPNLYAAHDGYELWLEYFYEEIKKQGADIEIYGVHDWIGRYEDFFTDQRLTYAQLERHIAFARSIGITVPVWVTETGHLDPPTQQDVFDVIHAIRAWEVKGLVDQWLWFAVNDEWWQQKTRLWDDRWQLTPVGEAWFGANSAAGEE